MMGALVQRQATKSPVSWDGSARAPSQLGRVTRRCSAGAGVCEGDVRGRRAAARLGSRTRSAAGSSASDGEQRACRGDGDAMLRPRRRWDVLG